MASLCDGDQVQLPAPTDRPTRNGVSKVCRCGRARAPTQRSPTSPSVAVGQQTGMSRAMWRLIGRCSLGGVKLGVPFSTRTDRRTGAKDTIHCALRISLDLFSAH